MACSQPSTNSFSLERNRKSSIRLANSRDPSNFNPVQRKVAWESNADIGDSVSEQADLQIGENHEEECVKDSFQPLIFASEDSSNEYDTDLETEPLCKFN